MTVLTGTDIPVHAMHRLVLGARPFDAATGLPLARPVHVAEELPFAELGTERRRPRNPTAPPTNLRPFESAGTARFKLRLGPRVRRTFTVRVFDQDRHIVPRRFDVEVWGVPVPGQPLPAAEDLAAADQVPPTAPFIPIASRLLQVWMYPGSAHVLAGVTGIRGRVEHAGRPLRWVRVEAVRRGTNRIVGRAHGDERGEFVLVVRQPSLVWPLSSSTFDVELVIHASPGALNAPTDVELEARRRDQLSDLIVETVPRTSVNHAAGELDNPQLRGDAVPATYVQSPNRPVETLHVGQLATVPTPYIVP